MAVLEMNKLRLVGLACECDKVMDTLSKSGVFEVIPTRELSVGSRSLDTSHLDRLIGKQVKIAFAIDYLQRSDAEGAAVRKRREKAIKKGVPVEPFEFTPAVKRSGRRIITRDDFSDGAAKEYELMTVADTLEKISFRRTEIKSESARMDYRIAAMTPYESLPLKFSEFKDTKNAALFLVYSEGTTANLDRLGEAEYPSFIETYPCEHGVLASVVTLKENRKDALELLMHAGFSEVEIRDDKTAKQIIGECTSEKKRLHEEDMALLSEALNYNKYLDELRILYDCLGLEIEKSEAAMGFVRTDETFVVEGWMPKYASDSLVEEIRASTDKVCVFVTAPEKEDSPPTLVKNSKIIEPFEAVTDMYSPPAYGELDPNPFMAVFFFIFYGVMMADAGYGLIMTVAGMIALKCFKLEKGMARLVAIIAMSGLSAIVWGLLLGGIFGIEGIDKTVLPMMWFNPISEPLMMFGLSLGLGVLQIVFGYGLYAYKCFKRKQYFAGIVDVLFKITVIIGVLLMMIGTMLEGAPEALGTAGLIVLIVSFVGIIATAGHNKPTVFGKIIGGFAGLYDLVNLVSDILSYARIFGLALASAAIALAFNTLGSLFFGIPIVGYVIGMIVLIPLHAINLGLGLLSGYIHNARLQFIEFYGRFYDGDGHLFSPMGEKTKYVRIDKAAEKKAETKAA